MKAAYTYGESKNTIDPGSIASGSWTNNAIFTDPNNPPLSFSANPAGHRAFVSGSYTRQYFGFGATTVAAFFDAHTNGNTSYIFSGDMNGDSATANDLIYIPRNTSEMNFQTFTTGGKSFSSDDQAAAFEAYILQDDYLSKHRGQYAARGALFYPIVKRLDVSFIQDIFTTSAACGTPGRIRLDINNFSNMLNHNWGVGQQPIQNRILSPQPADAQGRALYRLATVSTASGPVLINHTFQTTATSTFTSTDVYVMMLSFRYTFQ